MLVAAIGIHAPDKAKLLECVRPCGAFLSLAPEHGTCAAHRRYGALQKRDRAPALQNLTELRPRTVFAVALWNVGALVRLEG